jgi:hypothetical protein
MTKKEYLKALNTLGSVDGEKMKIEYHNDQKGKYQSWTATATIESTYNPINLEAYGATKEEARKALLKQITITIKSLLGLIEKL